MLFRSNETAYEVLSGDWSSDVCSSDLHSPKIERIEVAARGDVRRAKLYYLRDRVGKAAKIKERRATR